MKKKLLVWPIQKEAVSSNGNDTKFQFKFYFLILTILAGFILKTVSEKFTMQHFISLVLFGILISVIGFIGIYFSKEYFYIKSDYICVAFNCRRYFFDEKEIVYWRDVQRYRIIDPKDKKYKILRLFTAKEQLDYPYTKSKRFEARLFKILKDKNIPLK